MASSFSRDVVTAAALACLVVPLGAACGSDDGDGGGATDAGLATGARSGSGGTEAMGSGGSAGASGGSAGVSGAGTGATGGGANCACALGAYIPACGVDGVTYDATCGVECVLVDVACMGECPCPPEPGEYMGVCTGDGGFACNGDLVCVEYFEFSGGSGSGGRYCTQPCSMGCPAPSPGCGSGDRCDHI